MEIQKAIKKYLSLPNQEVLDEGIFYNVLKDLNAFEQIPASQHIMRAFVTKGYLKDIWRGKKGWQIQSRHYLVDLLGFQPDKVDYVINELEEGFMSNACKNCSKVTDTAESSCSNIDSALADSSLHNITLSNYDIVKIDSMSQKAALFFFQQKKVEPIEFENKTWIGYSKTINILRTLEKANIISHGSNMQDRNLLISEEKQIKEHLVALEKMNKRNVESLQDKIYKSARFFIDTDNADPLKLKDVLNLSDAELKFIIDILEDVKIISRGVNLHRRILFIKDELQLNKALSAIRKEYYPHI